MILNNNRNIISGNKEEKADITIFTFNWNVTDKLQNCIDSVLKTCKNIKYKWFIIDNNSRDADFDTVIKKYSKYNQLIFIKNKGNTGGLLLNNLIDKIDTPYILHLQPDTILKDNLIQKLIDFMNSRPDVGAAAAKQLNPDGSTQYYYYRFWTISTVFFLQTKIGKYIDYYLFSNRKRRDHKNLDLDLNSLVEVEQVGMVCFIERTKLILEDGYMIDPDLKHFYGDVDICKRIWDKGYKIYIVPWAEVIHDKGSSLKKRKRSWIDLEKNKAQIKYLRKYYKHKVCLLKLILILDILILMLENKLHRKNNKKLILKFRNILKW